MLVLTLRGEPLLVLMLLLMLLDALLPLLDDMLFLEPLLLAPCRSCEGHHLTCLLALLQSARPGSACASASRWRCCSCSCRLCLRALSCASVCYTYNRLLHIHA